ncbi:MAG: hypothetical protein HYX90_01095 [Chloroflexi bacterium]|nr:hypothetical protein [Chloroflexota bacterium]
MTKRLNWFIISIERSKTMAGNRKGGLKAKRTMLDRYGKDYYRRIGNKGGNPMLLAIRDRRKEGSQPVGAGFKGGANGDRSNQQLITA